MDSSGAVALAGRKLGPAGCRAFDVTAAWVQECSGASRVSYRFCSVMSRASTAGAVISRARKVGWLGGQPLILNTTLDERLFAVSCTHAGCGALEGWLTAAGNSPGRSSGIRIHRIG
jgi:hypothetical protein